ncbi:MAG TPA: flagellar basal-body rod protein FlgF [Xanthomonadaceae bacterium]|nr:flagellar basal-body rod protein FlgF [Xanthomonadaceae bacterium]
MFQALFNSLSGLFGFSRSLDTVSNNVANMNTPGFRGRDSFFENVGRDHGTRIAGEGMRTAAGDLRQTGNATDVAVDGAGFFALRDESGTLHYTRAGQFMFDDDGILIDSVSRFQVMALDSSGNLASISLEGYRSLPAEPSTKINFSGNLAPAEETHKVEGITIYDASGKSHVLTAQFTNNKNVTPNSFLVKVTDAQGSEVGNGELRFSVSGTLEPGYGSIALALEFEGTAQGVELSFGTPGTFQGTTSLAGLSNNVSATVADGRPVLGITQMSFDEKGTLQFNYGTSEKREGQRLALASFISESTLDFSGGRLVSGADAQRRLLAHADTGGLGKVMGGTLEMSNIDLTQEFADMLIIQRGYQASSRVMTVSNEMIEQLYNSTRGG